MKYNIDGNVFCCIMAELCVIFLKNKSKKYLFLMSNEIFNIQKKVTMTDLIFFFRLKVFFISLVHKFYSNLQNLKEGKWRLKYLVTN